MQQIAQPITITATEIFPPPLILLTHQLKPKTQFQKPIISPKWGRRLSGSRRSRKLVLDSIAFVASNLRLLPEPLDSLARELWVAAAGGGGDGGNGGKVWLRKGFGGGDGGDRRSEKLGFWVPLMISSALALWVVLERERRTDSDLYFWVLFVVSALAVYCMVRGWRREMIKHWVLGFSCGAGLMGLGLRNNENLVKWVDKFRANSPNFMHIARKKRRARRWI